LTRVGSIVEIWTTSLDHLLARSQADGQLAQLPRMSRRCEIRVATWTSAFDWRTAHGPRPIGARAAHRQLAATSGLDSC